LLRGIPLTFRSFFAEPVFAWACGCLCGHTVFFHWDGSYYAHCFTRPPELPSFVSCGFFVPGVSFNVGSYYAMRRPPPSIPSAVSPFPQSPPPTSMFLLSAWSFHFHPHLHPCDELVIVFSGCFLVPFSLCSPRRPGFSEPAAQIYLSNSLGPSQMAFILQSPFSASPGCLLSGSMSVHGDRGVRPTLQGIPRARLLLHVCNCTVIF